MEVGVIQFEVGQDDERRVQIANAIVGLAGFYDRPVTLPRTNRSAKLGDGGADDDKRINACPDEGRAEEAGCGGLSVGSGDGRDLALAEQPAQ